MSVLRCQVREMLVSRGGVPVIEGMALLGLARGEADPATE